MALLKLLRRRQFGDPILRTATKRLSAEEIVSPEVQDLIKDMTFSLQKRHYGVGLAAPQIGRNLALSVIGIKPTPSRPDNPEINFVIINPEIVKTYGRETGLWEGCISFGIGSGSPYAQALRYKSIRVRYYDEQAQLHEKDFSGLTAHVLQHEIDHLNGILFVDRVQDPTTYMTISEYRKRHLPKPAKRSKES